jgi:hypothetical protein
MLCRMRAYACIVFRQINLATRKENFRYPCTKHVGLDHALELCVAVLLVTLLRERYDQRCTLVEAVTGEDFVVRCLYAHLRVPNHHGLFHPLDHAPLLTALCPAILS